MDLPLIPILFMTVEREGREGLAKRSIKALNKNLLYDGELAFVMTCEKGSESYGDNVLECVPGHWTPYCRYESGSCGYRWNRAINDIFGTFPPIYYRAEDDFELQNELDITPYVKLLMEREDVGMVRLGLMPINLNLRSVGYDGRIYMDVLPTADYRFSGNPGLIHKRFHDAYGLYDEHCNPGDTEVKMDWQTRQIDGPRIWMPWDLGKFGTPGPFAHIGNVQSYKE